MKVDMVQNYVDYRMYEESGGHENVWKKDHMIYNMKQFKMDKKNIITEEDLEENQTEIIPFTQEPLSCLSGQDPLDLAGVEDYRPLKMRQQEEN